MSSENKFQMLLSIDEFNGCYNPCAACISKFESVSLMDAHVAVFAFACLELFP